MPDADWKDAPTHFVGWVPNVLGHLSFSLIGRGTSPDTRCASAEVGSTQEVVAHQVRQADDRFLHRWVTRFLRPPSVHDWLLIAKTAEASYPSSKNSPATHPGCDVYRDPRGMLRGTIHVLGGQSWERSRFIGQFKFRWHRWRFRATLARELRKLARSDGAPSLPIAKSEEILADFKQRGLHFGEVQCCLFRTGEARIWFEPRTDEGGKQKQEKDDEKKSADALQVVPKIAYFFLKDIVHRHTHHHSSQDSMIPFCEVGAGKSSDDITWQRKTMWALSRSIEEYVRRGTREDLRAATGMIPYAENFHALYGGLYRAPGELHKFKEIKDHEFDHYSFEGLRKMVASLLDMKTSSLTAKAAFAMAAIPIALSSIIAVNAVGTIDTLHPLWPQWVKHLTFYFPHWIVPVILGLMYTVYRMTYREAGLDALLFAPVRTFTRFAKAVTVSLARRLPLPHVAGFIIVVALQMVAFWQIGKLAISLLRSVVHL